MGTRAGLWRARGSGGARVCTCIRLCTGEHHLGKPPAGTWHPQKARVLWTRVPCVWDADDCRQDASPAQLWPLRLESVLGRAQTQPRPFQRRWGRGNVLSAFRQNPFGGHCWAPGGVGRTQPVGGFFISCRRFCSPRHTAHKALPKRGPCHTIKSRLLGPDSWVQCPNT